jgi:glycosyltransferase involved in cell wall biosynthesis
MEEIVDDGRTGLHFTAGDEDDLARKVEWAWTHPDDARRMGLNARAKFEAEYTAESNYEMLIAIYESVIRNQKTASERCRRRPLPQELV